MKKRILLGICLVLCLFASACSNSSGSDGGAKDAEQNASSPTDDPAAIADDVPTLPPDEALTDVVDPSLYTYQQLDYANGALTLDYPSHWNRVPGTNTICYIEPVSDGDTPARFALTKKNFEKTPSSSTKSSQLASFIKKVVAEYDSYEVSPLGTGASFLGDTDAYYATYTAVKGDVTVKGYVILAVRDHSLYAFHFRSTDIDYDGFSTVMAHLRDSITLK